MPRRIHHHDSGVLGDNHVLAFDGTTAFVSTETGVSIVDVAAPPGVVVAELPTPRSPTTAIVDADRLYVGSATAVTVIAPPCP